MVEFLLQNDADIDVRTSGEIQAPIHYAAKNGAAKSLKLLLGYQANIDSLDYRQRTPLITSKYIPVNLYAFLAGYRQSVQHNS
jgi:ankyrin repeat protein